MWIFADGTAIQIGGQVSGNTPFADWLSDLLYLTTSVTVIAPATERLDLQNPAHIHYLAATAARVREVALVSHPDPPAREPAESAPGLLY